MAYMNQEKKAKIKAAIAALKLSKSWRISLSVRHHSELVITILRAPATVLDDYKPTEYQLERNPEFVPAADNLYINENNISNTFGGRTLKVLQDIMDAVKCAGDWYDRSDRMTDYSNVSFWITMKFGNGDRDVELVGNRRKSAKAEIGAPEIAVSEVTVEEWASGLMRHPITEIQVVAPSAEVIPLFVAEQREPTLSEKITIARTQMLQRYSEAFRNTPAGAVLTDIALAELAEAALKVTVD